MDPAWGGWIASPDTGTAEGLTICLPSHVSFETGPIFPLKKNHNMQVYFLQLFQAGYPNCWQMAGLGLPWIRAALIHMKYIIALSPEW